MVVGTRRRAIVPSRGQSIGELAYGFIYKMVEDVAGKDGVKFFPYIMTLFMFIVMANFLGLIPMSFTTTSHFAVTVVLAAAGVRHRDCRWLREERRWHSWVCSGFPARLWRCVRSWRSSK